jgi:lipopolysaccharide export system protein LptA
VRHAHPRQAPGPGSATAWRFGLGACLGAALLVAASAGVRAQTGQHSSSLPIEITADRLDVVQPERLATFTGNVDAVQGDMVLSADLLRVYYNNSDGQDAAPTAVGGGSIRRIEAEGNVFLSSPRQTAQGKRGVYDVASDQLTLNGSVVLTQGDDVIRGDRLVVDLASGHSRVLAAAPDSAQGAPPQRVRALFVPRKAAEAGAPAAGPETPAGPAAGERAGRSPAKPAATR